MLKCFEIPVPVMEDAYSRLPVVSDSRLYAKPSQVTASVPDQARREAHPSPNEQRPATSQFNMKGTLYALQLSLRNLTAGAFPVHVARLTEAEWLSGLLAVPSQTSSSFTAST